MGRHNWASTPDDEDDDPEAPDPDEPGYGEAEEDDDDRRDAVMGTQRCYSCGRSVPGIYDNCPHCGGDLSVEPVTALAGRPWWFVWLGLLGTAGLIFVLAFPF